MRTLVLVSGGIEAVPGILHAKSMGLRVVVTDGSAACEGANVADHFLLADTYSPEQTIAALADFIEAHGPIHGVCSVAADVPVTVARVAEAFGLPGIPVQTAQICSDKLVFKDVVAKGGIPIPRYWKVTSSEEIAAQLSDVSRLVLKPVDSRGARGVLQVSADTDLDWAVRYSKQFTKKEYLILEEFIEGLQVSTEALVVDGKTHTLGFSSRNYEYMDRFAPHIVENGGDLPPPLSPSELEATHTLMQAVADTLSIENGILKGDVVLGPSGPMIIEVAPRLSGGHFCTFEIPLNTGVDFVGNRFRIALGERPDEASLSPTRRRCVSQRYWFPESGTVRRIDNVDEVKSWNGVEYLEMRLKPGDVVGAMEQHGARGGVVITSGSTVDEARSLAEDVIQHVRIHVEPLS